MDMDPIVSGESDSTPESKIETPLVEAPMVAPDSIRAELSRLPRVTDSEFRLACSDIADALARNLRFKVQVVAATAFVFVGVLASAISILGVGAAAYVNSRLTDFYVSAEREIARAKDAVETDIAGQFEKEPFKAVIKSVATERASNLLATSVEPAIKSFQLSVDERLADLDAFLKSQQDASAHDLGEFRSELEKLQQRNQLAALADKAIGDGDVAAYRSLEDDAAQATSSPSHAAALAELFRVYAAYSMFAPTRWGSVRLIPTALNPKKTTEDDLDSDDLYPWLGRAVKPEARARVAQLLAERGKKGSFAAADAVANALRTETHLEAVRRLRAALSRITGHDESGRLDGRELLAWWDANKEIFRAEHPEGS